ncbi:MAG: hypothetical protein AAGU05_10495 [Anaerolineaceae bacterium]
MEQKKFLATLSVFSLMAGCCVMLLLYPLLSKQDLFQAKPAPEQISASFFTALANGEYQTAFDLCAAPLQEELVNAEELRFELGNGRLQPVSWEILTRRFAADEVEFTGSMDFGNRGSGAFRITLRRFEQGWKVIVFSLVN